MITLWYIERNLRASLKRPPGDNCVNSTQAVKHFETAYAEGSAVWETGAAQPVVQKLAEAEAIIGDVLDVGCGTGENALLLSQRGHMVWGVDLAENAIVQAREKARQLNTEVTFVVGSAFDLKILGEGFHTVLDSGLFHFFDDDQRLAYVEALSHVMFKGSVLYLLCLSEKLDSTPGPRRIQRSEIRRLFTAARGFKVEQIEASQYQLQTSTVSAWLARILRV